MPFKALNNREKKEKGSFLLNSHKTKRSQSALEYMMTYGWAILIIVIVAVILYSMGIFNPSSSISTTITGFSSTPVSSAIFTDNGGLSLSVQNSVGYPIEITNITATTTTGGKVTIEPNITLLPGKSQVLVLSKLFTAASQGSHISTAVTITYKEISQQLPGPYISTGSITGSTPTVIYSANYTFAAVSKLTITNKQSSATPSPFQQMVNITSADNGWQLISNGNFGQNVEFFYSNGTIIPSWLESYTGSNAIWWLKLGSIPAGSSITVYMGIASTSTKLFNTVNDGEAPQIPCGSTPTSSCSNYAEYDDGAKVFNYYNDFSGTTLTNFLITGSSGYTIKVDNGLFIQGGSSNVYGIYLPSNYNFTKNSIFSFYITGVSMVSSNYWIGGGISSSQASGGTAYIRYGGLGEDFGYGVPTLGSGVEYGNTLISTSLSSTTVGDVIGLNSIYDINSTYLETINPTGKALWELPGGTNEELESPFYWEIGGWNNAVGDELNVSYTYIRSLPPNGVIPSVSFDSIA